MPVAILLVCNTAVDPGVCHGDSRLKGVIFVNFCTCTLYAYVKA